MIVDFTGMNEETLKGYVITTELELKRLCKKMMTIEEFAYDTETKTLRVMYPDGDIIVGISISWGENDSYYIPIGHFFDKEQLPLETVVKYLKKPFERKDVRIIGHNIKFDLHVLDCIGINIQTPDIFDTMVGSWIIDENEEKGLKHITNVVYQVKQTKFDECLKTVTTEEKKLAGLKGGKKAPFCLVRINIGAPYAIADAYWTWRHYCDWQLAMIEEEGQKANYYKGLMPFVWTLYNMEKRGARIDKKRLEQMAERAKQELDNLTYQIYEIAGIEFKISSSQQLGEILYGYKKFNKKGEYVGNKDLVDRNFGFEVKNKTDSGAPSTSASTLKELSLQTYTKDKRKQEGVKMIKLILKHKRLSKLDSAFIHGLLEQAYSDGKVHPSFNVGGASSGRISCSEPNLQQLPRPIELPSPPIKEKCESEEVYQRLYAKYEEDLAEAEFWKFFEIRDAIIPDNPEKESLIALDFSNLEMRLLAHFSQDPNLIETFTADHDAHGATAVNMFNLDCTADEAKKMYKSLRQIAKTLNFINQCYQVA